MSKRYKTIISRYVEDDLVEIIEYYSVKNESYAQKLLFGLETKVDELKSFPERGRVVPELKKQNILVYRELMEGNYRMLYAIEGSIVTIHTILDSRRNIEDLLLQKLLRMYS